jgi:glycosyltransferase involved in cell wall biosynthesis
MNILYLIDSLETSLPRDQNYIIKYMSEKGHQVTVLTTRNQIYENYDCRIFPKVQIFRTPKLFNFRAARIFFHPLMLNRFKKYDVVHAFTFFTFSSLIAPFIRSNKYFLRSEILDSKQTNYAKANKFFYKELLSFYKIFYTKVYGFSTEEALTLKTLGFPMRKILIIPPMIDQKTFSNYSRKSQDTANPLVIGTISRITPVKGIHKLVEILDYLMKLVDDKFIFILAGRIDNQDYAQSVLFKLKILLGNRFQYLGEVASPKIFYEQVDVVIVPSLAMETGAIVTLESMAAGKVVVANNVYPMNTYIQDSLNGILYDSYQDASKKIANLIINPCLKEFLSYEARKDVVNYDLTLVCERLEKEYLKNA